MSKRLAENSATQNTGSICMRVLRAVNNRAIEQGSTPPTEPFKRVNTRVDMTLKQVVDTSQPSPFFIQGDYLSHVRKSRGEPSGSRGNPA